MKIKFDMSIGLTLFVVFLVLKLVGVITWSWFWVTSPLWIPLGIVVLVYLVGVIVRIAIGAFTYNKHKVRSEVNSRPLIWDYKTQSFIGEEQGAEDN